METREILLLTDEFFCLLELQQWVNTRGLIKDLYRGLPAFYSSHISLAHITKEPNDCPQDKNKQDCSLKHPRSILGVGGKLVWVLAEQLKPPQFSPSYPLSSATPQNTAAHILTHTWNSQFSYFLIIFFKWFYFNGIFSMYKVINTIQINKRPHIKTEAKYT